MPGVTVTHAFLRDTDGRQMAGCKLNPAKIVTAGDSILFEPGAVRFSLVDVDANVV